MYARNVLMCLLEFLEVFQKFSENYANQYIAVYREKNPSFWLEIPLLIMNVKQNIKIECYKNKYKFYFVYVGV